MSPEVRRELVIKYLDSALKENKPPKTPEQEYSEWRLEFVKRNWELIKKITQRDGYFVV